MNSYSESAEMLMCMGFCGDEVPVALNLARGDAERAVSYLTRDIAGLDAALVDTNNSVRNDYSGRPEALQLDDDFNKEIFPTSALTSVQAAIYSGASLFFGAGNALDRCIQSATYLLGEEPQDNAETDDGSTQQMNDFIERILPECVSRHVNPVEVSRMDADSIDCCYAFCSTVVQLLSECLNRPSTSGAVCRSICELFSYESRFHKATKRRGASISYDTKKSSGDWIQYASPARIQQLTSDSCVRLQEFVDQFCNCNGLHNIDSGIRSHADSHRENSIQDLLCLLRVANCLLPYLSLESFRDLGVEWLTIVTEIVDQVQEKEIRNSATRSAVLELFDELKKLSHQIFDEEQVIAEYGSRVDMDRLSFLLKCLKCSQLDARMFALQDVGHLADSLTRTNPSISDSLLNSWLKENGVLKIVLSGNLDMEAYVEKIRPILSHMAVEMTDQDLAFVWSLRRGRLGVSADRFVSILTHIASRLNIKQIDVLFKLFAKAVDSGETRICDRVFFLCNAIGKAHCSFDIANKIVQYMWELIVIVRKRGHDVVGALKMHIDLLDALKNGELRETYSRKAMDLVCQSAVQEYPFSYIVYLRDILQMGPRDIPADKPRYQTRKYTAVSKLDDAWGDRTVELQRTQDLDVLLRDRDIFEVLISKLAHAQCVAHEKLAAASEFVIPGESSMDGFVDDVDANSPLNMLIYDGFVYESVIDEILLTMEWMINTQIVPFSLSNSIALWDRFVSNVSSTDVEKTKLFTWLAALNTSTLQADIVRFLLERFCQLDPVTLIVEGVICLSHFHERLISVITADPDVNELSNTCTEYHWQLVELSTHREVVEVVSRKLIENGSIGDVDGKNHLQFLQSCYNQLTRLSSEYFVRHGLDASPVAKVTHRESHSSEHVTPETPLESTTTTPETVCAKTDRVARLDDEILLRGIDRLLRLIGQYTEAGDERYQSIRNFPSHGAVLPGRSLSVEFVVENDSMASGRGRGHDRIQTNTHEPIGQFKARLDNRLHFRNVNCYSLFVEVCGEEKEVLLTHPWKTLEQVGLVPSPEEDFYEKDSSELFVNVTVKPQRFGSSSSFRNILAGASSRCLSEAHLPAIIISKSAKVYDVIRRLQSIPDDKICESCCYLLSVIPNESSVESAFRVEKVPNTIRDPDEMSDDDEDYRFVSYDSVMSRLDASRPHEMLYALEVLLGILVPVQLSSTHVKKAGHLHSALVFHDVGNVLMQYIEFPERFNTLNYELRCRIFEAILTVLGCLYDSTSVAHCAIDHDSEQLLQLEGQHTTVEHRRKDMIYKDISQLNMFSAPDTVHGLDLAACTSRLETLRNFVWALLAGQLHLPNSTHDGPSSNQIDVGLSGNVDEISSQTIRKGKRRLSEQDCVLAAGYLRLLFQLFKAWLKSKTNEEQHDLVSCVMKGPSWSVFWTDMLVFTDVTHIRRASENVLDCVRGLGTGHLYLLAAGLFNIVRESIFSAQPSKKLADWQRRQRLNGLNLVEVLNRVIRLLGKEEQGGSNGIDWSLVGVEVDETSFLLANQIVNYVIEDEIIDTIFLVQKIKILASLIYHGDSPEDVRIELGQTLIPVLVCDKLFPQFGIKESDRVKAQFRNDRWSNTKLRTVAIMLVNKLTSMCGEIAALTVGLIRTQFGHEQVEEWNHRPNCEEREFDHVGLKNDGGTCYMNSVLQQLFSMPGLAKQWVVLSGLDTQQEWDGLRCSLVVELQRVFARLLFLRERVCVPRGLWAVFRFTGEDRLDTKKQHDAVDFLTEIVDRCDTIMQKLDLPLLFKPRLQGKFAYEYICYECHNRHQGPEEDFLTVNLELHGTTLEESFQHYVDGEILEGDNAFICTVCKEKRTTLRRGSFHSLPETLSIQLKRFTFDFTGRQAQKNNEVCKFPRFLDMGRYIKESRVVEDKDIDLLFEEICSSSQQVGLPPQLTPVSNGAGASVSSSYLPASPSSPMKWSKRRRRISTMASQQFLNSEEFRYELVGVLAHSGLAAAGHYYSYVKEHRDEMESSPTFNSWLELNDAVVKPFPIELETENAWFGGHFRVPKSDKSPVSISLPEERTRTWNAYVLFYEKVKSPTQFPMDLSFNETVEVQPTDSLGTVFANMPEWLQHEIIKDNSRFCKERELYSRDFANILLTTANHMIEWLEEDVDEADLVDPTTKAIDLFRYLVPYCCNVLWKLSAGIREALMEKSKQVFLRYLQLSQDMRDIFFDVLSHEDYKLFDEYANSPVVDVWIMWWDLIGHALDHSVSNIGATLISPDFESPEVDVLRRAVHMLSNGCQNETWRAAHITKILEQLSHHKVVLTVLRQLDTAKSVAMFAVMWEDGQLKCRLTFNKILRNGTFSHLPNLFVSLLREEVADRFNAPSRPNQPMYHAHVQWLLWWIFCHCEQDECKRDIEEIMWRSDIAFKELRFTAERINWLLKWVTSSSFPSDTWSRIIGSVVNTCASLEGYCRRNDNLDIECTLALDVLLDASELDAAENGEVHGGLLAWMEEQEYQGNHVLCDAMLTAIYQILSVAADSSPKTRAAFDQRCDRINALRRKLDEHRMEQSNDSVLESAGGFTVDDQPEGDRLNVSYSSDSGDGKLLYGTATALVTSSSDLDLNKRI